MALPFNATDALQYQLCIDIYPEALSLGFAHLKEPRFHPGETFTIKGKTSIEKSNALQDILKTDVFDLEFGEMTANICQTRNTLVPVSVFNDSKAEDIFHFNFMLGSSIWTDRDTGEQTTYNNVPQAFDWQTGLGYSDHLPVIMQFEIR